jgi:hypothetical protein
MLGVASLLVSAASGFQVPPQHRKVVTKVRPFQTFVHHESSSSMIKSLSMHHIVAETLSWGEDSIRSTLSSWSMARVMRFILPALPIGALLIAIVQASIAVWHYRRNFGDAPIPKIPCHGVVVVASGDHLDDDDDDDVASAMPGEEDFLRLLLVGDSLAIGIGQSVKCTPVMPEVISGVISKATGKAVYWT